MKNLSLSVVVPVYNEVEHIQKSIQALVVYLNKIIGVDEWELVFVNNGSTDGSEYKIIQILKEYPNNQSIYWPKPNYGEALRLGIENAKGQWAYIINVDAWDPEFLKEAWERKSQFDYIIGSKRLNPMLSQIQFYRRFLSWGLNTLLRVFLGFKGTDTHGLKLLNLKKISPIAKKVKLRRGQFDTELTLRAQKNGLAITELPVRIQILRPPRNLMFKKIAQNILDIFRLWWILRQKEPEIISVHDATPKYMEELKYLFQKKIGETNPNVHRWIGIVPNWGGEWDIRKHPEFIDLMKMLQSQGWELVLHGLTHGRPSHPPFYKFLFKSKDIFEFRGLSKNEAEVKLQVAVNIFEEAFGFKPKGFIAPNWTISMEGKEVLKEMQFEFVGEFSGVYWLKTGKKQWVWVEEFHIRYRPIYILVRVILGLLFGGGHVVFHPNHRGQSILKV